MARQRLWASALMASPPVSTAVDLDADAAVAASATTSADVVAEEAAATPEAAAVA